MKITVITVCFNEEKNIKKTVESVLSQTSSDFEYIICDGNSADKTVEIARSYGAAFAEKGVSYTVNSERDKGIYDGMNKGIELAFGDYIYFLNAGDWFYSDDIIERVVNAASDNSVPDFLYGDVAMVERGVVTVSVGDDSALTEGMSISHQAVFSSTSLMKQNNFKLEYKIAADYDFLLSQKLQDKTFFNINSIVAYFATDGLSTQNLDKCIAEQSKIKKNYGIEFDEKRAIKNAKKIARIVKIKGLIPQWLWQFWSVKIRGKTLFADK